MAISSAVAIVSGAMDILLAGTSLDRYENEALEAREYLKTVKVIYAAQITDYGVYDSEYVFDAMDIGHPSVIFSFQFSKQQAFLP